MKTIKSVVNVELQADVFEFRKYTEALKNAREELWRIQLQIKNKHQVTFRKEIKCDELCHNLRMLEEYLSIDKERSYYS